MSKKKKKHVDISQSSSAGFTSSIAKSRVKNFIIRNRIIIIIFLSAFALSLVNNYTASRVNPVNKPHDDAYFYYQISKQVKEQIFDKLFSFINGIITNSFSSRDYQMMGFTENDIQSIFRAPGVVFIYGFLFFLFGVSFHTILIANSFFFAIESVLIFLIGRMLFQRYKQVPILLSIIFMIYAPIHILTMYSITETIINLMILLSSYFYLLSFKDKKSKYFFSTGILIYFLSLTKVAFIYLGFILFFWIIFLIYYKFKSHSKKKYAKAFIFGFMLVLLLWKFVSYRATGELNITSSTWKIVSDMSAGRVGWTYISPINEGLDNNLGRDHTKYFRDSVSMVKIDRNNLWLSYSLVGKKAIFSALKSEPFKIMLQSLRKFAFLVVTPFESIGDSTQRTFLFSYLLGVPNNIYHNLIILLSLFSLLFFYKHWEEKSIFVLLIFAHFFMYSVTNPESRYITTAMPLIIIMTGYSIEWLISQYKRLFQYISKYFVLIFISLILIGISAFVKIYILTIIATYLFFISLTCYIFLISNKFISTKKALLSASILFFTLIFVYSAFVLMNGDKDRGTVVLNRNKEKIIQYITLKENFDINLYDEAVLMIDSRTKGNGFDYMKISINDNTVQIFTNNFPVQTNIFYLIDNGTSFSPAEYKWVLVSFPIQLLVPNGNEIKIEIETLFKDKKGKVLFYYDKDNPNGYFIGPSFFRNFKSSLNCKNSSIWTNVIDARFTEKYQLESKSRKSYVVDVNGNQIQKDLRVYILLKRKGGYFVKEEYKFLDKMYYGFNAFLNPVGNGLVKWFDDQKDGYIPAGKNVRNYIETEFDRYYSGYEIY